MILFKLTNDKAESINFAKIKNEKELQTIVENNLESIFRLTFIESEFRAPPFRIDTLAFDNESKSFVIIEYKESEDYSVVDQGFAYLNLLLNHKGDFQLALERKLSMRIEVDWSQSRIIFIAKAYNTFQLGALANNMPFELWKYAYYEGNMISFEQLLPQFAGMQGPPVGKIAQKVEKEIRVYTLEDHLGRRNATIRGLFEDLQQRILKLNPEVKEKVKKKYIGYQMKNNFTELVIQASAIIVYLDIPIKELKDGLNIAEDCTNVGHWATGDSRFKIHSNEEVPYAMELIRQALEKNM